MEVHSDWFILDWIPDGILIIDAAGRITFASHPAEAMFGFDPGGLLGEPVEALLAENLRAAHGLYRAAFQAQPHHRPLENVAGLHALRRDGSQFPVEISLSPLSQPGPPSVLVIVRDITERKRLEAARRRELTELAVLHASAMAGASATDIDALVERATDVVGALFPEHFGVGLVDEASGDVRIHSYRGPRQDMRGAQIPLGHGVVGRAVATGQAQRLDDVTTDPDYDDRGSGMRSELCVPLKVGDRTIGVINAESPDPAAFSLADERLLTTFAGQLAAAIENIRLTAANAHDAHRRNIVYQASRAISASLDPEHLYAAVHRATTELMPTEAFVITLVDDSGLEVEDVYLWDRTGRSANERYPVASSLTGYLIQRGEPLLEHDFGAADMQRTGAVAVGDPQPTRSLLAVPLRLKGRIIGMLSAQSYQPHAYTPEDQALLEMLAVHVVVALDNARLFREVQQLSRLDSLSGVYNRRHLFELCQREFDRARRYQRSLSGLMLDLDNFKRINDTYGHAAGDVVLAAVAARCQHELRAIDLLGRYGGEEFALLLPETDADLAQPVAERLRAAVSAGPVETPRGPVAVTISVGVAALDESCPTLDSLLDRADQALYTAKRAGRNQVALWTAFVPPA